MENRYENRCYVRTIESCNIIKEEEIKTQSEGYGNDFYEITEDQIQEIKNGKILCIDSQQEYGVYLKVIKDTKEHSGYHSSQHTICAVCGEDKHTPLRNDVMGGYVCMTCIDKELNRLQDFEKKNSNKYLNINKFVAGFKYVSKKLEDKNIINDFYKVVKIMYFADKKSIIEYHQFIFKDWIALDHGPVIANLCYVLSVVGENNLKLDMDEFSESDIECMNYAIEENSDLIHKDIEYKSKGIACHNTIKGELINPLDIIRECNVNQDIYYYMKERLDIDYCYNRSI